MKRIKQIWEHLCYQEEYKKIQSFEENRIFCNHTLSHFLDVARLMWIYNLEEQAGLKKENVYAVALLHDIGRARQYAFNVPHHIASAELASKILSDCGYAKEEILEIQDAILFHRVEEGQKRKSLGAYLIRADKKSRNCMNCAALYECNWSEEKKNMWIEA